MGDVFLAHSAPPIPATMGLPDLSHQLQKWPCHLPVGSYQDL